MAINSICPNCNSDNTQPVALAIVGVTNADHGSANSGDVIPAVIEKYSMSLRPVPLIPWIAIGIGAALVPLSIAVPIISFVNDPEIIFYVLAILGPIILATGIFLKYRIVKKQRKWDYVLRHREKLWFCIHCGKEWIPGEKEKRGEHGY